MVKFVNMKIVFFSFVIVLNLSCGSNKDESAMVAQVGQSYLTADEIASVMKNENGEIPEKEIEHYVYRWIDNEVFYLAAIEEGIARNPEIIEELKKVKRDLVINYYIDQKLKNMAMVSDTAIKSYYEQNQNDFIWDTTEYRYFYLICKDRSSALSLLREIRKDTVNYNQLIAENFPEKIINRVWDSGYVPIEKVIPPLQRIMVRLNPGRVYGPVASDSGPVIFKLMEKYEAGSIQPIEQVEDTIRKRILEERYREQYQKLLVSLKNKMTINFNLDNIKEIMLTDTVKNEK